MCKVSVIVPMYNGEKTIARCLDSLIRQSLQEMEILVVDDGSVDNGSKIVTEYGKRDKRVRLISQKNCGNGAARNRGIRESKGKYIAFVDCDDFVDFKMLDEIVTEMEKKGVSVAVCQEKNVYIEDKKINFINETQFPVKIPTVFSNDIVLEWLLNYTYMSLNSMCYKVVEKKIFEENNLYFPEKYRYAEDMVTSVGVLSTVQKVLVIPKSYYYYVHIKGSLSYTYTLKHAQDILLDWQDIKKYVQESGYTGVFSNFFYGLCFTSLKQIYWCDNKKEKNSEDAKMLEQKWSEIRKKEHWKPVLISKMLRIPITHKIKILVVYWKIYKPVYWLIKKLDWIPFFKYMA